MMFLAVGIYALFVSTNYWERYYTLVPSAVALGMAIVPLWASMGITTPVLIIFKEE